MKAAVHSAGIWPEVPLGELLSAIEAGKNLRCEERPPKRHEKGVIKVSSVTWGAFDKTQSKTLPSDHEPNPRALIRNGDFLISRANTLELVGACVLVEDAPNNLYLSDKVLRLVLPDDLKPWLLRFLKSSIGRDRIEAASTGNQLSMRNIGQEAIRNLMVPLPGDSNRRRIVAKVDSLSLKSRLAHERLDHIPRLVEKYKQAILTAAYERASQQSGEIAELGDIAEEVKNGLSKKPTDDLGGTPILRISAVRPLKVRLDDLRHYPKEEALSEGAFLRDGDLLFTRYNGNPDFTAVCGMVRGLTQATTYPDKLIRVRLSTNADPAFVELISATRQAREWLAPYIKSAAGQHGISGADLKRLPVPLPSLEAQRMIVRSTSAALTWIDRLASEAANARKLIDHLDQAVLAKAFQGELVPKDPNDEPAEVLLERLRTARDAAPAETKVRAAGTRAKAKRAKTKRRTK